MFKIGKDFTCLECGHKLDDSGDIRPHGHHLPPTYDENGRLVNNDGYLIGPESSD